MSKLLAQLGMEKAVFKVKFSPHNRGLLVKDIFLEKSGSERVEFLLAPGKGEALRPLQKVASGGELSRIMLALKTIFSSADSIPLLVFDEVDAGIGGKTAVFVGKLLKELSQAHQVICVTHLPQIASLADSHFVVYKDEGARLTTRVKKVEAEERVQEIARLLSGDESSEVALNHARELLSYGN